MSPLERFPGCHAALPPAFCGGIGRFALIAACGGRIAVDTRRRFDKRFKSTHRCTIADTRGPLTLTVPIEKPASFRSARWSDIIVSGHGEWPRLHVTALESAYGRTPFYEFYADRFTPLLLGAVGRRLVDLDADLENLCLRILGIEPLLASHTEPVSGMDFPVALPYWQLRADRLGFIPDLSILDLIFNLGPEAPLHLKRLIDASDPV